MGMCKRVKTLFLVDNSSQSLVYIAFCVLISYHSELVSVWRNRMYSLGHAATISFHFISLGRWLAA